MSTFKETLLKAASTGWTNRADAINAGMAAVRGAILEHATTRRANDVYIRFDVDCNGQAQLVADMLEQDGLSVKVHINGRDPAVVHAAWSLGDDNLRSADIRVSPTWVVSRMAGG